MKIKTKSLLALFAAITLSSQGAFAIGNATLAQHCDLSYFGSYLACQASVNAALTSVGLSQMALGQTVDGYSQNFPGKGPAINAMVSFCGGLPTEASPPTNPPTYVNGGGSDGHACN